MKKLLLAFITFVISTSIAIAAVNLNTATKDDLDKVKGIGPVKAQSIIDYRKKNGPFKSVDELENVKGFGSKSVNKVRSELTVNGVTNTKPATVKATDKKSEVKK
jgi:competence protein ComEA